METIKVGGVRLAHEEREVYFYLDPINKTWMLDAFTPKYFRKALKQGWTPIREYIYEDGTVCGMSFIGPERAVTIRNVAKKKSNKVRANNLLDK